MKNTIKKTIKVITPWLVPRKIVNVGIKTIRWALIPPYVKNKIRGNVKFLNNHKGERCFILATGPSIAKQNLLGLRNETCIAVGDFYLHPDAKVINPEYQVIAPMHQPFDDKLVLTIMDGYKKQYSENTTYFFGYSPYESSYNAVFNRNPLSRPKKEFYINYSGSRFLEEDTYKSKKMWDICGTPFSCMTVVFSAIQIALYMGFDKIYLLGCDHDYLERKLIGKGFDNHHFYKDKEDGIEGIVKFLDDFSLEQWFYQYYYRWKQYRLMKQYAQEKGQVILNATHGGMLDVFDRVKFEDIKI